MRNDPEFSLEITLGGRRQEMDYKATFARFPVPVSLTTSYPIRHRCEYLPLVHHRPHPNCTCTNALRPLLHNSTHHRASSARHAAQAAVTRIANPLPPAAVAPPLRPRRPLPALEPVSTAHPASVIASHPCCRYFVVDSVDVCSLPALPSSEDVPAAATLRHAIERGAQRASRRALPSATRTVRVALSRTGWLRSAARRRV